LIIRVGCCGFQGGFKRYISSFDLVEVQQTFYKIPKLETCLRWRSEATSEFEFTIKAWQLVTHPPESPTYRKAGLQIVDKEKERYGGFKQTPEVFRAWEEVLRVCKALDAKIVLFQCPKSFRPTEENLRNMRVFFQKVKRGGLQFVFEPRGEEWSDEVLKGLCAELGLVHGVDPFSRAPVTTDLAYFRLHGSPPGVKIYRYRYTDQDLRRLLGFMDGFKEVYCLFNNIYMLDDALRFKKLIGKEED
jgi:uncharacterized protein YecE (DUF72 family)